MSRSEFDLVLLAEQCFDRSLSTISLYLCRVRSINFMSESKRPSRKISNKLLLIVPFLLLFCILSTYARPAKSYLNVGVRSFGYLRDSLATKGTKPSDSLSLAKDSLRSVPTDTLGASASEEFLLEDIIEYEAEDSMVLLGQNRAYLFGKSNVKYQASSLSANFMRMNMDSSTVYSHYVLDSVGRGMAYPVFQEGQEKYEAKMMRYNFKTGKGYINGVVTQQGEGYITARETKKMPGNEMFMRGGKYTTCSDHDHPHFYINMTKAKVRAEESIVTGPVNLVIADVPLPIGLPFGFFPFSKKYSSGVLMPSYGEDSRLGFYLRKGGYYFAFNDYVDLALRGDFYSLGSWGISAESKYRKRYKYNGSLRAEFLKTVQGDKKITGNYTAASNLNIQWSHQQDPKSNPLFNFSANVNYSSMSYYMNSIDTHYDMNTSGQSTRSSNVSFTRNFLGTPFRLTGSADITQNMRDSTVHVNLPNLNLSMTTLYPLKRKKRVGPERWYERLSLGYSMQMRNSLYAKNDMLLKSNLVRDWKNGVNHDVRLGSTFNLFDNIKLTLNANYRETWYTKGVKQAWNAEQNNFAVSDTTYGFKRLYNYDFSAAFSTTLYGMFKPIGFFRFGDRLQMIRHRITPTVSFGYKPDFGAPGYGFWEHLEATDSNGNIRQLVYSPYSGQPFGAPSIGKSGSVTIGLDNNLEAKIRSTKDSVGTRKISLIDQLSVNTSYNMVADSMRWSDISTTLSLRFTPQLAIRLNALFDPYCYDYTTDDNGAIHPFKVDRLRLKSGKGLGRLMRTGTSFSYTFNNEFVAKLLGLFGKKESVEEKPSNNDQDEAVDEDQNSSESFFAAKNDRDANLDSDGYFMFKIPWNLSFNYSWNLAYDLRNFNVDKKEFRYLTTQNLGFSGSIQPTPNWSFNFNANYNIEAKKVTALSCSLRRNMHCWAISVNFIPLGPYKSYNFTLSVSSQLLQDLKWEQSNRPSGGSWY